MLNTYLLLLHSTFEVYFVQQSKYSFNVFLHSPSQGQSHLCGVRMRSQSLAVVTKSSLIYPFLMHRTCSLISWRYVFSINASTLSKWYWNAITRAKAAFVGMLHEACMRDMEMLSRNMLLECIWRSCVLQTWWLDVTCTDSGDMLQWLTGCNDMMVTLFWQVWIAPIMKHGEIRTQNMRYKHSYAYMNICNDTMVHAHAYVQTDIGKMYIFLFPSMDRYTYRVLIELVSSCVCTHACCCCNHVHPATIVGVSWTYTDRCSPI